MQEISMCCSSQWISCYKQKFKNIRWGQINYLVDTLKRKNALVSLGTPNGLEDYRKQQWWMTEGEETVGQIKITLQDISILVSESTVKRRLHNKYRGFTTNCEPQSLKNRKARLVCQKTCNMFWENIWWTDWNNYQLAPEWWEKNCLENEKNCSWSKTWHPIYEAWGVVLWCGHVW